MTKDRGDGQHPGGSAQPFAPHPVLATIEAHWRDLRDRSHHLPRHADLDPSRMAGALSQAFVLERLGPGMARLSNAGRGLSALFGAEARGLPLSVLFTLGARDTLGRRLDRCFEAPALVELALEARQGAFRTRLSGRILLLPMLDREDRAGRALGGLVTEGSVPRPPVKFDLPEVPARVEPIPAPSPPPGFSDPGRPYLRLVVDNG